MPLIKWFSNSVRLHAFMSVAKSASCRRIRKHCRSMEFLEFRRLLSADVVVLDSSSVEMRNVAVEDTFDDSHASEATSQFARDTARSGSSGSFTGTVQSVEDDNEIRVQNTIGKSETFTFDVNTKVVDDKGNDIKDIKTVDGRRVTVDWEKKGTKQVAKKITVHGGTKRLVTPRGSLRTGVLSQSFTNATLDANIGSFVGTVQAVEKDNEIRVANTQGTTETFKFDSNTKVVDQQGNAISIDTLDGLRVKVEWQKDGTQEYAHTITVLSTAISPAVSPVNGRSGVYVPASDAPAADAAILSPIEQALRILNH